MSSGSRFKTVEKALHAIFKEHLIQPDARIRRLMVRSVLEANDTWLWDKARKQHWGRDVLGHLDFLLDESSPEEVDQ